MASRDKRFEQRSTLVGYRTKTFDEGMSKVGIAHRFAALATLRDEFYRAADECNWRGILSRAALVGAGLGRSAQGVAHAVKPGLSIAVRDRARIYSPTSPLRRAN
jgi:hypothetical protein